MLSEYRADGTRKYHIVNVVYSGIDYRGPDRRLTAHVSTTQPMYTRYRYTNIICMADGLEF